MKNFFLLTRGRTGSTAIIDELNSLKNLCVHQELFLNFEDNPSFFSDEQTRYEFRLMPPFDIWKKNHSSHLTDNLRSEQLKEYLDELIKVGHQNKALGLGFKLLSNNFVEKPWLDHALKKQNFSAILLLRENIVKMVISGLIANQTGIYNARNHLPSTQALNIDLDEFEYKVFWEMKCLENDRQHLCKMGFKTLEVTYENFCNHREMFYKIILGFLNIPFELPAKTEFSIMTPELHKVIANYEPLKKRVNAMGMIKFLVD